MNQESTGPPAPHEDEIPESLRRRKMEPQKAVQVRIPMSPAGGVPQRGARRGKRLTIVFRRSFTSIGVQRSKSFRIRKLCKYAARICKRS
jgi:hypothetical protein